MDRFSMTLQVTYEGKVKWMQHGKGRTMIVNSPDGRKGAAVAILNFTIPYYKHQMEVKENSFGEIERGGSLSVGRNSPPIDMGG